MSALRSRLQLVGAALLFSTAGAVIKSAQFSNWQIAGFRSGIAAVTVLLLVPGARRNWDRRVLLAGIAYAATLILFVTSTKLTTAANAIFLQSTAPLYLVLLGPWILKERIRAIDFVAMAVIAAGMGLFFLDGSVASKTAPNPSAGNIAAVCSGLAWSLTLMSLRWMEKRTHRQGQGMAVVAAGNLTAFLVCLPFVFPVASSHAADWVIVSYLGIFQIGLAYFLLTAGVRGVEAFEVSLLLMVETALNPFWAFLVHGERPGRFALFGACLIVAATLAWQRRRA